MDDEKLIENVRLYPVLYDMSNAKYLDTKYKNTIWANIAKELNVSSNVCKSRWSNIRDQFKKSLNKRKGRSGQSAISVKKYKYEDALQFLLDHVQDRSTRSNIMAYDEESPSLLVETGPIESENYNISNTVTSPLPNSSPTINHNPLPQEHTTTTTAPARKRKLSSQTSPSASQLLMNYIISNKKNAENVHPIDAFFNGIAPTIKRFSPYYQHLAKSRIFQVIQDLEWEQLTTQQPYGDSASCSYSTSSTTHPAPPPPLQPIINSCATLSTTSAQPFSSTTAPHRSVSPQISSASAIQSYPVPPYLSPPEHHTSHSEDGSSIRPNMDIAKFLEDFKE